MTGYLSNLSAVDFWKIPYIEAVLGAEAAETKSVHFTVTQRYARSQKKGHVIHLCELDLPAGAVVSRKGQMVASPELTFLEFASQLSIHRLILLGLQLCSHPPGNPFEAITTKQKIKNFVAKSQGHRGHRKAARAVKYIEDGSASVMESIAFMILTLPHALGGYGLGGAVFNYEFKLKDEAGKRLGQNRCFMDLFYKTAKIAIEYESFAFHNSQVELGKDAIRSAALERHGVEVMHLKAIQLYNKDACSDFAINLASRLGRRIQIRTSKFNEMNKFLRSLLPVDKNM
ncbi:MAG: hypothetical protein PHV32_09525 [Eubacteriales bacterium]|nr:hypothetical protein [Eubacteriales bacterium]